MGTTVTQSINYWLTEHPSIKNFRWYQSWGSTWLFLFTSISACVAAITLLDLTLTLFRRRRPVPLGPIPAIHSLIMTLISGFIFVGILLSAAAEIRDTRWFWRRSKTPLQWLLCFPLGTRPSGRVFFWSYLFYLTRFLHLARNFFSVLRRRKLTAFQLFKPSVLILMSYLWLEFSQSFQILGILWMTLISSLFYGYVFWTAIGFPSSCFPIVLNCEMVLLSCNLMCHFGVLLLHLLKGGCNGIGAWVFNSMLDAAILMMFLKFYVNMYLRNRKVVDSVSSSSHSNSGSERKTQ